MLINLRSYFVAFCLLQLVLWQPMAEADYKAEVAGKWLQVEAQLKNKNIKDANQALNELENIKEQAGISEMLTYSRILLHYAENYWAVGDKENAKYLGRKALELSPVSPEFLIEAAPCLVKFGIKNHIEVYFEILKSGIGRYDFIAMILIEMIYPVLWAMTFAALACAFMLFTTNIHEMLSKFRKLMPKAGAAYSAPGLLLLALCLPLCAGPIWTIVAYTILIYLLLPRFRLFGALCSVMLILWASLIPVRENMRIWLSKPEVKTMLSVASGIFSQDDAEQLGKIASNRPLDHGLMFLYAKTLKRAGELDQAEKIILQLKKSMGPRFEIDAELGTIKFLKSESEEADAIYKELEKREPDDAALLINYSKVRFDLLDTEQSRTFYERASLLDKGMAENFRLKEEKFGIKNIASTAEFYLPPSLLLKSSLFPEVTTRGVSDKLALGMLPYINIPELAYFGAGLLVIFLFISGKPKPRRQGRPARDYTPLITAGRIVSILPGGNSVVNGKLIKAFMLACCITLLSLPLFNWPSEFSGVLGKLTGLELYYVYGYCFLMAALSYVGFASYEGEAD